MSDLLDLQLGAGLASCIARLPVVQEQLPAINACVI